MFDACGIWIFHKLEILTCLYFCDSGMDISRFIFINCSLKRKKQMMQKLKKKKKTKRTENQPNQDHIAIAKMDLAFARQQKQKQCALLRTDYL